MTEKVKVQVPINLEGTPVGVKDEGGVLDFITREVEVECLPGDIPQTLELDVSDLEIGSHYEVKDLELPEERRADGRAGQGHRGGGSQQSG